MSIVVKGSSLDTLAKSKRVAVKLIENSDRGRCANTGIKDVLPESFLIEHVYGANEYDKERMIIALIPKGNDFKKEVVYVKKDSRFTQISGEEKDKLLKQLESSPAFLRFGMEQTDLSRCIGSDPEIFLENEGNILPAWEFLPDIEHKKLCPGGQGSYFWDGFAAEINPIPTSCMDGLGKYIRSCLIDVLQTARAKYPKAKFSDKSVIQITNEAMQTLDPQYLMLGCTPSLNIYNLTPKVPLDGTKIAFRSAGGHMHFEVGRLTAGKEMEMIKALDAILGVMFVSLLENFDSPIRREFYGLPGEFRRTKYSEGHFGLEYRALSNGWLRHPAIAHLAFDIGRAVCCFAMAGFYKRLDIKEEEILECLFTCNAKLARKIMSKNKHLILSIIEHSRPNYGKDLWDGAYNAFYNGIESIVNDPTDIEGNWNLGGTFKDDKDPNSHWDSASYPKRWWNAYKNHIALGKKI